MITVEFAALPTLDIIKLDGTTKRICGPHFGLLSEDTLLEIRTVRESRRRSKEDINYYISIVEEFKLSNEWIEAFFYLWARAVK